MKNLIIILCFLIPGIAIAQRGTINYDNKVIINESSSDALQVSGGILVGGDITLSGKLKIGSSILQFPTAGGSVGQFLQTDGSGNLSWQTVSSGAFTTTSNVTSNAGGTLASDDFVFGSSQLDDDENTDHDSRMYFDKSKAAFRVGAVTSTQWDSENVAYYSFGAGYNVTAIGTTSVAFGETTTASGGYSTVFGYHSTASGWGSVAFNANTTASGESSAAFGYQTTASGNSSAAFGFNTTASDNYAAAFGSHSTASARYAVVFGYNNTSDSYAQFTLGQNAVVYGGSNDSWVGTEPLFVIGNGISSLSRSNAVTVLKNGNTAINGTLSLSNGSSTYTLPNYDGSFGQALVTDGNGSLTWTTIGGSSQAFSTTSNITSNTGGDYSADNFVFGSPSLNSDGNSDHNRRMLFEKSTGTFRAGYASSTEWDSRGDASVAFGYRTEAPGDQSAAWGNRSKSIGAKSTAFGYRSEARKDYSTAWGYFTYADSYMETVFGQYNTEVAGNTGWVTTDRLLVIGNGTSVERSDALVMLKNGNTTLKGTFTLTDGSDSYTLPNTDGTNGQVLQTNGSGSVSWQTPSGGGGGTTCLVRVYASANTALSNESTWYDLDMNNESFDVGNDYSTETGSFTAPSTGYYEINFKISIDFAISTSAWNKVFVKLVKNGTVDVMTSNSKSMKEVDDPSNSLSLLEGHDVIYLTAGDILKLRAIANDNSENQPVLATGSNNSYMVIKLLP